MKTFPRLSYVCPIPWGTLRGDERQRYCEKCGLTVTNLSELNQTEREALLARVGTERLCVSYYRRLTGEDVTPEAPLTGEERSRIKQVGVAVLSAGALALAAGCTTSPVPQKSTLAKPPVLSGKAASSDDVVVLQAFGMIGMVPSQAK